MREVSPALRPRKRFGQHFLHDPQVLARIAAAIDPKPGDRLVEIGPGPGTLTAQLLQRVPALTAIEIDRDLATHLAARFDPEQLTLFTTDALEVDFTALRAGGAKLRVVGNLPYNISTPLLFHLLKHRAAIADMHFMLQKEVVDRMAAAPGGNTYGRLTVMLAPWLRVEPLFNVGPGAFRPPPQVTSAVVRLLPRAAPPFALTDEKRFDIIVRTAFSQRRKTLRNALKGWVSAAAIEALGIDPGARAETLAPAQFAQLASLLPDPPRALC